MHFDEAIRGAQFVLTQLRGLGSWRRRAADTICWPKPPASAALPTLRTIPVVHRLEALAPLSLIFTNPAGIRDGRR